MNINATVEDAERRVDSVRTVVLVEPMPNEPIAPATLVTDSPWTVVAELHKVVNVEGPRITFESYGDAALVPALGTYRLQQWWTAQEVDLVTDISLVWTREPVPLDADGCDWCPLTWRRFGHINDTYAKERYRSNKGQLISIEGYEKYIREDLLRLRKHLP